MSAKTIREIGIDCLGVDPFLKKIGLDGDLTVQELQDLLTVGRYYICPGMAETIRSGQ